MSGEGHNSFDAPKRKLTIIHLYLHKYTFLASVISQHNTKPQGKEKQMGDCCSKILSMETTLCKTGWPGYSRACWSRKWSRFSLIACPIFLAIILIIGFTAPREDVFSCYSSKKDVTCRESSSLCNECFCARTGDSFDINGRGWCASYDKGSRVSGGLGIAYSVCIFICLALSLALFLSFCIDHGGVSWCEYCDAGCCCLHPTDISSPPATPPTAVKDVPLQPEQAMERGDLDQNVQESATKEVGLAATY